MTAAPLQENWTDTLGGIPVRQRDQFAAWLRERGMVRYDSHQVARDPGRPWWIFRGSDGWLRAVEKHSDSYNPSDWMRAKLSRAGITVVESFTLRFKRLP